ncbi:MAG TPA: hypothetical protein VE684_17420 [Crenalkalicoccus sp.]|jgi:hypothetical protein|nr:hypothetical protein [Crenalkalicoccus sp.]
MNVPMRRPAILLPLLLLLATPAAGEESRIGSWRLACATDSMTDRTACRLVADRPVEPSTPGRPALALEIIAREGRLVPAVTLRELSWEGALRGLLALDGTAQLRFPPNPLFEMPCDLEGRSLVCAPRGADLDRAERELAEAPRVLVRVVGLGGESATAEPAELRLSGTKEAMARLRQEAPPGAAAPARPGLDGPQLLQRLLRLFGS